MQGRTSNRPETLNCIGKLAGIVGIDHVNALVRANEFRKAAHRFRACSGLHWIAANVTGQNVPEDQSVAVPRKATRPFAMGHDVISDQVGAEAFRRFRQGRRRCCSIHLSAMLSIAKLSPAANFAVGVFRQVG